MTRDEIYAAALYEVNSGARQPGLWARCFAEAGGDESKAKAAYVTEIVQTITKPTTGACPNCDTSCEMSALECNQCGALFDGGWKPKALVSAPANSAPTLPLASAKGINWWLWLPIGAVTAFLIFGAAVGNTPAGRERAQKRDAISFCWAEQQRKSLAPESQRFIAGACEQLENAFVAQFGTKP